MKVQAGRAGRRGWDRGGRFLIPLVVVMGITSLFPALYSLYMSLFDWNWGSRFNFVGLANRVCAEIGLPQRDSSGWPIT